MAKERRHFPEHLQINQRIIKLPVTMGTFVPLLPHSGDGVPECFGVSQVCFSLHLPELGWAPWAELSISLPSEPCWLSVRFRECLAGAVSEHCIRDRVATENTQLSPEAQNLLLKLQLGLGTLQ